MSSAAVPSTEPRRRSLPSLRAFIDILRDATSTSKGERRQRDYGTLDGPVAFSSRRIAARRAIESEQHPRLFCDPLAAKLAGTALEDARRSSARGKGKGVDSRVSRIAVRTRWFDDEVEAALRGEAGDVCVVVAEVPCSPSSPAPPPPVRVTLRPRLLPSPRPTQVVSLGCGMDTRPWRLDFPDPDPGAGVSPVAGTDVSWFDVDSPCVLRAKERELLSAGAEVPPGAFDLAFEDGDDGDEAEGDDSDEEGGERGERREEGKRRERGERRERGKGRKPKTSKKRAPIIEFPLKAASYRAVPADLSRRGALLESLRRAGHDRARPTVFVAEGLLMYLGEDGARACLSSAAEAARVPSARAGAPGSVEDDEGTLQSSSTLLAVTITPSALESARERSSERRGGGVAGGVSGPGAASDLLAAWNFGCSSSDLPGLLRETGWLGGRGKRRGGASKGGLLSVVTRGDMARRYARDAGGRGFEYEVPAPRAMLLDDRTWSEGSCARGVGGGGAAEAERGSLFFVARRC